jgi:hypothetical protein
MHPYDFIYRAKNKHTGAKKKDDPMKKEKEGLFRMKGLRRERKSGSYISLLVIP